MLTLLIALSLADIDHYKDRYVHTDALTKITDNRGKGFEELYGTRNMRPVLHGVYYRGGANNLYHRTNPRSNTNPLQNDGLENLCKEGFGRALYFYSTNYNTAPKVTECSNNTLHYDNVVLSPKFQERIIKVIYENIMDYKGPIYGHCWNGWHATGLAAATALMQFCDYTNEQAMEYWLKGADGTGNNGYSSIKTYIKNFKPINSYRIPKELANDICPR